MLCEQSFRRRASRAGRRFGIHVVAVGLGPCTGLGNAPVKEVRCPRGVFGQRTKAGGGANGREAAAFETAEAGAMVAEACAKMFWRRYDDGELVHSARPVQVSTHR
jgi:hypothetical protein